jgi:hypothetical protein
MEPVTAAKVKRVVMRGEGDEPIEALLVGSYQGRATVANRIDGLSINVPATIVYERDEPWLAGLRAAWSARDEARLAIQWEDGRMVDLLSCYLVKGSVSSWHGDDDQEEADQPHPGRHPRRNG